jgi:hypothetical protein
MQKTSAKRPIEKQSLGNGTVSKKGKIYYYC